jgi:rhodanese-related sulfurtransferase
LDVLDVMSAHRRGLLIAGAASCSPFAIWAQRADEMISLDEARRLHEASQAILIDIRENAEHATGVAAGALLMPMSQLGRRVQEIPLARDKPVLLICNTQNRSANTLRALRQQLGDQRYAHVRYVHGGMSEWAKRGWPMVAPPKP